MPTSRSQARPVRYALLDLFADGGAGGEQARVEFVSTSYASQGRRPPREVERAARLCSRATNLVYADVTCMLGKAAWLLVSE